MRLRTARLLLLAALVSWVPLPAAQPATKAASPPPAVPQATPESTPAVPIDEGVWQLREYAATMGLKQAVGGAGNGYVAFEAGGYRINAGCDTLRGSYWLDGSNLLFSPHVASTLTDCPPTLRSQELSLLLLLPKVARVQRQSPGLRLLDAGGHTLLTLARPQTSPLQRRLWRLLAYRDRDSLVVPALTEPEMTLSFDDAAHLSGIACEEYRAGFVRDERFLRLEGPIAGPRLGCPNSATASRQAEDFLEALRRVDSYRVDASSLLLRDADGRMIARFSAADPPRLSQQASPPGLTPRGAPSTRSALEASRPSRSAPSPTPLTQSSPAPSQLTVPPRRLQ